ncbi:chloride channel CLIC-like protein 1 isoform X2 [Megalobrama amblycephala]|uniref:chloride channel CLIC-like protein 1 isoform X2 n=1 Tax=Megalobrama amblycephala TaxID=75352 RepID=UPI002013FB28|nr:chloride channel CLIC-like protein 1 isoform X2 [Megalobrama amblycephala]
MKVPSCSSFGFWSFLMFCSLFVSANDTHQEDDDAWIDPYDVINYDSTRKSMIKPTEKGTTTSSNPVCLPVFKRFLYRLLEEASKLGLPDDEKTSMHYDAEVKLSKQSLAEIQKLLNEQNDWTTGAMDEALSQILVKFKHHNHEAWKWRFEDTFHVEVDTVLKVAFAEHKKKIVEVESFSARCAGLKELGWKDNLLEWYRQTWTLQDDPCKKYHEVMLVDPILLVPPTKAVIVTITGFITDPLKKIGEGINEFLRALLKDLPITLQMPVLLLFAVLIFVLAIVIAKEAIHQIVHLPWLGWRRDPPTPAVGQHQAPQRLGRGRRLRRGRRPTAATDRPGQWRKCVSSRKDA